MESWSRADLGISISYPYEWVIAQSPFGEALLYVEDPSRLPSLMISVRELIPDIGLEQYAHAAIAAIDSSPEILGSKRIEIDGVPTQEVTFNWLFPQG